MAAVAPAPSPPDSPPRPSRRRSVGFAWCLPLLVTLIAGLLTFFITEAQDDVYRAETLLVIPAETAFPAEAFAGLATHDQVLRETIRALRLPLGEPTLARAIEASIDGRLIEVSLRSFTARDAQSLLQMLVTQMAINGPLLLEGSQPLVSPTPQRPSPDTPGDPEGKGTARNTALAVAIGLVTGIAIALMIAGQERPVRSVGDLLASDAWPILGLIPRQRAPDARPPAVAGSPAAAAYERLARSLAAGEQPAPRTVLVAGAHPRAGASTVAVNLAMTLTQAGTEALLVDANFERPSIHDLLQLPNDHGLSDALSATEGGVARLAPHYFSHGAVWALTSGALPPDPAALFSSERTRALLEALATSADIVVLDAPALPAPETITLARLCDTTLVVLRAGRAAGGAVRAAADALAAAGVEVAAVMTAVPERDVKTWLAPAPPRSAPPEPTEDAGADPGAVEERVVEQPVVEDAIVEDVVVEDPVVEEPVIQEPSVEEIAPAAPAEEDRAAEEPAVSDTPVHGAFIRDGVGDAGLDNRLDDGIVEDAEPEDESDGPEAARGTPPQR